jgi:hypothetical protein
MAAKVVKSQSIKVQAERLNFRGLLLANPNYFGNVKQSQFKPVVPITGNTTYEELGCVGYQPQAKILNAVVYQKLPYGFGGDICSTGSQEYVRFYASSDGGTTWADLGLASYTTFDIPESPAAPFVKLEYAVSLPYAPFEKLCFLENLIRIRGILSWDVPPPPNDPDFAPVWGNIHDTTIEVAPGKFIILEEALTASHVQLNKPLSDAVDLTQRVATLPPKELTLLELQRLYANANVPPHRYGFNALNAALNGTAHARLFAANFAGPTQILGADIDVEKSVAALLAAKGNTTYEELDCVGLNVNTLALEGIIRVKQPSGYNGGPCSAGSNEYVTFWADLDGSGAFSTCLGTASVTVYDNAETPKVGAIEYAVTLPTTLFAYRQPCEVGPKLIPIRATLSWQVPPPCADPDYVPTWGNSDQTLVCLPPGPAIQPGVQSAFFDTIGSMSVTKINSVSGLADGTAATAGFTAVQSPFGGQVNITGYIYPASNLSAGAAPLKYRISVSADGGVTWTALNNPFTASRQEIPYGGTPAPLPDFPQAVDASGTTAGYYTYLADWTTGPGDALIIVAGNILAQWQTAGLADALWKIKMDFYDPSTSTFHYGVDSATILLDNTPPNPNPFLITSGGGSCGDFHVGEKISGTYSVSDLHFYFLELVLLPPSGGAFTAPTPLPRYWTDPGASTFGDAGSWTLDTTGLPPCGYVVELNAYDRTIVNSGYIGNFNQAFQGFCLKA